MIDLRYLTAAIILAYAAYLDLKTRRCPNLLIFVLLACGAAYDWSLYANDPRIIGYLCMTVLLVVGVCYLMYNYKSGWGGGDVKIFFALGVLFADNVFTPMLIVIVAGIGAYVMVKMKPEWKEKPPMVLPYACSVAIICVASLFYNYG